MKILIAEDEEFTASTYQTLFEAEGYSVIVAENGTKAVTLAQSEAPDIVLLDILMPEEDGFAALEKIKKAHPDLPVIVVSNLGQQADKERAAGLGASDYLVKADMEFEDIVRKVHEYATPTS